jgi:hypothetical protein
LSTQVIYEPARQVPVFGSWDVVVIGGGIAGVAAALATARAGASVCLVEKENALGGLATLGNVLVYLPLCDGKGRQVSAGLAQELLLASLQYSAAQLPECWQSDGDIAARTKQRFRVRFNPASYMISLEELVFAAGIQLMYDTRCCAVRVENDRINAIFVENKSGRGALMPKVVIDASGDADVCYLAGEATVSLKTNRRAGWYLSYKENGVNLHMLSDPLPAGSGGKPTFAGDNWQGVTQMNMIGRQMIKEHLVQHAAESGFAKMYPVVLPTIPLFRMTRRLQTEFELDESDDHRWFDDTVGMIGDWRKAGPVFCIPYRTLTAKRVGNLLTAGRCISVTESAWEVTRVIPACAVTGQAAGTAAVHAIRMGCRVDALNVGELQKDLSAQGVIIKRELVE